MDLLLLLFIEEFFSLQKTNIVGQFLVGQFLVGRQFLLISRALNSVIKHPHRGSDSKIILHLISFKNLFTGVLKIKLSVKGQFKTV